MWSYYGSKSKVVKHYPKPKFDRIIEPFAGSARYSLKWFEKDILLVDKYEIIIKVWRWLQSCSPSDIIGLPSFRSGDDIRSFNLIDEARCLMGFCIGRGNNYPSNVGGKFNDWDNDKKRIAKNLFKIKHWKIQNGCYTEIKNQPATWFIDPPYFSGGHKYKHSNKDINFQNLSKWSQERLGQVIVCENTKADWLPFKPMVDLYGSRFKTTEAIWSNYPTVFDNIQLKLDL